MTTVAISPNGSTIACGIITGVWEDKEVALLFDRESGVLQGTITGFPTTPTRVRYSPDGRYLRCSSPREEVCGFSIPAIIRFLPAIQTMGRMTPWASIGTKKKFYRPLLLQEIPDKTLTDREVLREAKLRVDIATLKKPPLVSILSPEDGATLPENTLSLAFEVTDQGGGVSEILLYQNGKLIYREKEPASAGKVHRTIALHLVPEKNEFRLKALNEESTESHEAICTVYAPQKAEPARLFLIAVGISDYADPGVKDLASPQGDAKAVSQAFKSQEGILFREVIPILLTDQDATRANVEKAMNWVVENAQEDDEIIFLWSGHGGTQETQGRPLFYLFPPHEALLKP